MPKRLVSLLAAVVLLWGVVFPVIAPKNAGAAQLQERSLKLSSSANGTITTAANSGVAAAAGSGGNGQKTREDFSFKIATSASIGSILIQFCDDPIPQDACLTGGTMASSKIAGFDASNVTAISAQTGWGGGSQNDWTLDTTTVLTSGNHDCQGSSPGRVNCIAIKRASAEAETATTAVTLAFGGTNTNYITNPTNDSCTTSTPCAFYARITTYSDTAYTPANLVDYGTVVGSTAQQIDITSKVKEVLNFSVSPIATTPPGSTCTPLADNAGPTPAPGAVTLGDSNGVLSFTTAYDAHSYFRISTNTNGGVSIAYSGDTLKNGSNQISAMNLGATTPPTADASRFNRSQFGLAIDSSDLQGGNGYSFTSLAATDGTGGTTDYSNGAGTITDNGAPPTINGGAAKFAFDPGSVTTPVIIASSTGPVSCDTASVRYLGNISTATPAGIYYTTITYIATGKY